MLARQIAQALLDVKAVTLSPDQPYTWASGLKSPIYCDNRITISYPTVRQLITNAFVDYIKEHYPTVDAIVGTATAGIPQACWIADKMALPTAYVRAKAKDHGKTNQIEGRLQPGSKVIVIEDLISTGKSSIQACEALMENDIEVLAVLAVFTYEMEKAATAFANANIKYHALSNFTSLIDLAHTQNYVNEAQYQLLKVWKNDPIAYDQKFQ